MKHSRRKFISSLAIAGTGMSSLSARSKLLTKGNSVKKQKSAKRIPIGISTYSFWQFDGPKENAPIEKCIDEAARMGFDSVELLLYQMASEDNAYLQKIKRRTFHNGLDIMGFSTHQGF